MWQGYEITSVFKDGGAWRAGVVAGEVLVQVDGVEVKGLVSNDVKKLILGPEGPCSLRGEGGGVCFALAQGRSRIDCDMSCSITQRNIPQTDSDSNRRAGTV